MCNVYIESHATIDVIVSRCTHEICKLFFSLSNWNRLVFARRVNTCVCVLYSSNQMLLPNTSGKKQKFNVIDFEIMRTNCVMMIENQFPITHTQHYNALFTLAARLAKIKTNNERFSFVCADRVTRPVCIFGCFQHSIVSIQYHVTARSLFKLHSNEKLRKDATRVWANDTIDVCEIRGRYEYVVMTFTHPLHDPIVRVEVCAWTTSNSIKKRRERILLYSAVSVSEWWSERKDVRHQSKNHAQQKCELN